jgi:hypothetical protein
MANRSAVPHHRVDAALHAQARAKADSAGVSMSAVATAGLSAYAANANDQVKSKATAKIQSGRLDRDTPTLPAQTANELIRMSSTGDSRFVPFLKALHAAGWSYATLATPLNLSRQAIHLRLAKYTIDTVVDLPAIPSGPGRGQTPAVSERFDWAVWVEREIYAVAAQHASERGNAMRDVMEQILADYVKGTLKVTKNVSAGTTNSTPRKAI